MIKLCVLGQSLLYKFLIPFLGKGEILIMTLCLTLCTVPFPMILNTCLLLQFCQFFIMCICPFSLILCFILLVDEKICTIPLLIYNVFFPIVLLYHSLVEEKFCNVSLFTNIFYFAVMLSLCILFPFLLYSKIKLYYPAP